MFTPRCQAQSPPAWLLKDKLSAREAGRPWKADSGMETGLQVYVSSALGINTWGRNGKEGGRNWQRDEMMLSQCSPQPVLLELRSWGDPLEVFLIGMRGP